MSTVLPKSSDLSKLFEMADHGYSIWSASDLASVMHHQMQAPLVMDTERHQADEFKSSDGAMIHNLYDLIQTPTPPLSLLELIKDFAKTNRKRQDSILPPEVATVVYYMAIALAKLRCGQNISQLQEADVLLGIEWVLEIPWIETPLRDLFGEARDHYKSSQG